MFIVIKTEGTLKEINKDFDNEIRSFKSLLTLQYFPKIGSQIRKTIDCFTWGGVVKLFHEEYDVVEKEYSRIREMEDSCNFFICE